MKQKHSSLMYEATTMVIRIVFCIRIYMHVHHHGNTNRILYSYLYACNKHGVFVTACYNHRSEENK